MFVGCGSASSVTQAAAAPGNGVEARRNTLVVLVKTNAAALAAAASSSRFNVPVTLTSTKAWRPCVTTCGLCSVAVHDGVDAVHARLDERAVGDRAEKVSERQDGPRRL